MASDPEKLDGGTLLLLCLDAHEREGIRALLEEAGVAVRPAATLAELKDNLKKGSWLAVVLDLDAAAVDNRTIRDIAISSPDVPLLCLSRAKFHPELKDSISSHVYACLTKPVDRDELDYWLKCLRADSSASNKL
jgi:DNA-binding NtrC family response regulator